MRLARKRGLPGPAQKENPLDAAGPLQAFPYSSIVTALALVEYTIFVWMTGRARGRLGVPAPTTTGNTSFERYFRIQGNSVEQLVVFLPGMFLFAAFVSDAVAAGLGLVFILGRALYARAYISDPARRGPGFGLTLLANVILALGALVGAVVAVL
jgi:glutathione S-transferase